MKCATLLTHLRRKLYLEAGNMTGGYQQLRKLPDLCLKHVAYAALQPQDDDV